MGSKGKKSKLKKKIPKLLDSDPLFSEYLEKEENAAPSKEGPEQQKGQSMKSDVCRKATDADLFKHAVENLDPAEVSEKLDAELEHEAQKAPEEIGEDNIEKRFASGRPGSRRERGKRKKQPTPHDVDLHGCTVDEARVKIDTVIQALGSGEISLNVITGKGRHSRGKGPVLAREIHTYMKRKYHDSILEIEDSPADATINGVAIKGHFFVRLRI